MHQAVDIETLIDRSPVSGRQFAIVFLCGLLAMIDGFDGQAIAFAAPGIAKEFSIPPDQFGAVFGAGSFGSLTGIFGQGPLGDRFGRKTVLVAAFLIVSLSSLLTVLSGALPELVALRFLAGLGLGGALPNLFAITAEYAPKRRRSTFVTVMFCGFPLGAIVGGMATANLLPLYGWRLAFYLGGLAPLVLLPAVWFLIPESLAFLATQPHSRERIARILGQINLEAPAAVAFGQGRGAQPRAQSVRQLFTERRAPGTVLLWTICFLSLFVSISLTNWLPSILYQGGVTISMAVMGGVVLNGGGMLGALLFSFLADKLDVYKTLSVAYLIAALFVGLIGAAPVSGAAVTTLIFLAGFFCIGAQMCFGALVALYYPSALRATGVGWAMGLGRIGAIIGPTLTGLLLAWRFAPNQLFYFGSTAILAATVAVAALGLVQRRQAGGAAG